MKYTYVFTSGEYDDYHLRGVYKSNYQLNEEFIMNTYFEKIIEKFDDPLTTQRLKSEESRIKKYPEVIKDVVYGVLRNDPKPDREDFESHETWWKYHTEWSSRKWEYEKENQINIPTPEEVLIEMKIIEPVEYEEIFLEID